MRKDSPRGRFVWHDLMTNDPVAAIGFYTKTVGWGTEVWRDGGTPYTMWKTNSGPVGGVMAIPPGSQSSAPHWLTYICSANIDLTCEQAESLGGKVRTRPTDFPQVGRYAVVEDPQGAVFAPFTPRASAPGHDGPPQLGEFSWHELATTDCLAALKFYSTLFGWESTGQFDTGATGIYHMFGRRGTALGGMYRLPPDQKAAPHWLPYARVEDVKIAAERTSLAGGKVVQPPTEVPGGDWVSIGLDPQGGAFAVHALKEG